MKHFLPLIMLFAASGCCQQGGNTTLSATQTPMHIEGRYASLDDGSISFDWSGVYIDIRFTGTYLAMEVSDTKRNFFNHIVDGTTQDKFTTEGDHTTVVLFDNKEAQGEHIIRIQKATEAEQGQVTIHSFTTDGEILSADDLALPRHIEFYGDSLTCGYGTESESGDEPFMPETENCCYTYAALTAAHFGADYNLISHSGRGLVRNYGDAESTSEFTTTMSSRAFRTYDEVVESAWDFQQSHYSPDAIVITLGTNDFSTQPNPAEEVYIEGYRKLIDGLRQAWGKQLPVLCVVHSPHAVECVREMVATIDNCAMADISNDVYNRTTDLGASEHPNKFGQAKMAKIVIAEFAKLTDWQAAE
jgi:lysophospholipase L1-like esterase